MRIRRTLKAAALAVALTFSSCHFQRGVPLVEQQNKRMNRRDSEMQKRFEVEEKQHKAFFVELKRRRKRRQALLKKYFSEDPNIKVAPLRRFSCDEGLVLPGALKTHAYVFLQIHKNPLTGELGPDGAQSQITIFRVLQHLAKMKRASTIFYEGLYQSKSFDRKSISQKGMSLAKKSFKRCINEVVSKIRTKKRDLPKQREVEDICLVNFYVGTGLRNSQVAPLYLLISDYPGIRIMGFERKASPYEQAFKLFDKHRQSQTKQGDENTPQYFNFPGIKVLLDGLAKMKEDENRSEVLGIIFSSIPYLNNDQFMYLFKSLKSSGILKSKIDRESCKLWHKHGKYLEEKRSAHAIESVIGHSSQNTALVIGEGHFSSIVSALLNVNLRKRPTIHFLESECTNRSSFVTPFERMSAIVDVLVEKQKNELPK
jgi:hypothetical protein